MRYFHLHRCVPLLALIAAMLLSAMPTVNRLHQAMQADSAVGITVAMCTVAGLKLVTLPLSAAFAASEEVDRHDRQKEHPMHDCDYCPVLAGLIALVLLVLGLWRARLASAPPILRTAPRIAQYHPCGLGSRGPPLPI
ncbi:MAG: DUF2946 family protein [Dokdonella sp.]